MKALLNLTLACCCALIFPVMVLGQTDSIPPAPFGANPISNDQFAVLLSIDYDVRILSNGWLEIQGKQASFFAQSSPSIPEINFRKAWPNTVSLTANDVNLLNANLSHGGLHLDPKSNEVVLEFSDPHLVGKPSALCLLASIEMFEMMIDAVVDMIADL